MHRKGDISCQPGLSRLSGSRFINHVRLHKGEWPPFLLRSKTPVARGQRSLLRTGIKSGNAICQEHASEGSKLEGIDVHHLSLKFDEMKVS